MATFCPSCGTARTGSFRFCRSCGLDFDALPPAVSPSPPPPAVHGGWVAPAVPSAQPVIAPLVATTSGTDPATYRLLTMLAWLGSALSLAWLALVQFSYVGTIIDDGTLGPVAGWNLVMAALIVYGAVRLQRSARQSSFRQSAIWAIVIVLLQGFQIVQGATHVAYVISTVGVAGAGVLAWLTYQALPADVPQPGGPPGG